MTTDGKTQALRLPRPEISHHGIVRPGAGVITSEFPPLKLPNPESADRGAVRLGAGVITADFVFYS
jgi:hypothetical protein